METSSSQTHTGLFWNPSNPEGAQAGTLNIRDGHIKLTVSGQIADPLSQEPQSIHGQLDTGEFGHVSLIHCWVSIPSQRIVFGDEGYNATTQDIYAKHLITDMLVNEATRYTEIRIHCDGLNDWLQYPEPSTSTRQGEICTVGYPDIKYPIARTNHPPGDLTVLLSVHQSTGRFGSTIEVRPTLTWYPEESLSLQEIDKFFITPIRSFFGLITLSRADVDSIHLGLEAQGHRIPLVVYGDLISGTAKAEDYAPRPIATLPSSGLELVARWLDNHERFSPSPEIVTGVMGDTQSSWSSKFSSVVVATEGLHRRLHPEARGLNDEEIAASKKVIQDSDLDKETKAALYNPLRGQLKEPTLKQRLITLASEIDPIGIYVCGFNNEHRVAWAKMVGDARNNSAHMFTGDLRVGTDESQLEILTTSLLLLTTVRVLKEMGEDLADIGEALWKHPGFKEFRHSSLSLISKSFG